jgi:outer membrane protein assembly factor BamA
MPRGGRGQRSTLPAQRLGGTLDPLGDLHRYARTRIATAQLWLLFAFSVGWPGAGWAQEALEPPGASACEGQAIAGAVLEGCEDAPCGRPDTMEAAQRAVLQTLGDTFSADRAAEAIARLRELGLIQAARWRCELAPTGATVFIEANPISIIREVRIEGPVHFYIDDIRKRVFLREGNSLEASTEAGQGQLRKQRDTLLYFYERAGFVDTEIDVTTEDLGSGELRLRVRVSEGHRNEVDRVAVRVKPPRNPTPPETDAANWRCPVFTEDELREAAGVEDLDVYTTREARDAKTRLKEFLQSRGWVRPHVELTYEREKFRAVLEVGAESCWILRFRTRNEDARQDKGYQPANNPEWLDSLTFGSTGAFDFEEADYGRELLQGELERKGFLFADVKLDWRKLDSPQRLLADGRTIPAEVAGVITYDVSLGSIIEIRRVEMPGARAFDESELLERLGTRPYSFFGTGGYMQLDQVFSDLETLRRFYRDEGYLSMKYRRTGAPGQVQRTIRRNRSSTEFTFTFGDLGFRVKKPDGENIVYLGIPITEGPRSMVSAVEVTGCVEPAHCEIALRELGLEVGDTFSPKLHKEWTRTVKHALSGLGFPNATLVAECAGKSPALEWGTCDAEAVRSEQVALRWTVDAGPRVKVGPVILLGNFTTDDAVIRRDLPRAGDWLSPIALMEGERQLRNLGVFDSVAATVAGVELARDGEALPITVRVEERSYQFLDLAIGFESFNRANLNLAGVSNTMPPEASSSIGESLSGAGRILQGVAPSVPFDLPDLLLVGQAEYINLNLFGLAQELRIPFKYGVTTADPLRLLALAPTWVNRRFFGTEIVFRATAYGLYDRANDPFDRIEGGLDMELSQQLFQQLFISTRYAVSATSIRDLPTEGRPDPTFGDPLLLNKPELRVSWERVDTPTHPTEGFGLVGRIAYLNSLALATGDFDHFIKYGLEGRFFLNIRKIVVFANFARFAGSLGFPGNTNASLPVNERYYLGGNKGVRGFEDGEITRYARNGEPVDADPTTPEVDRTLGGDYAVSGTHELRFPLGFSIGPLEMWGAGFFDWGGISNRLEDFHSESFRLSAGGGVRALLYGRVPVRIDYGVKLDRRCRVYSTAGCEREEDLGELQFNILYTF